jgi:Protein of unknown function (DUF4240)
MNKRLTVVLYLLRGAALALCTSNAFGETMDNPAFWQIIGDVKAASGSTDERPQALRAALEKLPPDQIQEFQQRYVAQVYAAYTWPLWGAAYVMNGGCSDDCFDYFRDWLISEGQSVYEAALDNPESLAGLEGADNLELEEFRYIAHEVFEAKTGEAMELTYPESSTAPSGDPWDEDAVDKLFPTLAAKYR